ncbi:MAG TPA: hypothetical protein VJ964_09835 [Balneolaceae bacterium]|nr:hypothetical protein [Balneolaceae bacterium]
MSTVTMIYAQTGQPPSTPLTDPGNQIFGAIQETIRALEKDPNTNWSQVNIEALRQHLLDMKAFTEEVEVLNKQAISMGVQLQVHPLTERAKTALKRVLMMHPAMLKKEKGWKMESERTGNKWTIRCTTTSSEDVPKIRALGYIGLLATGAHHQRHHWMIATGKMKYPPEMTK